MAPSSIWHQSPSAPRCSSVGRRPGVVGAGLVQDLELRPHPPSPSISRRTSCSGVSGEPLLLLGGDRHQVAQDAAPRPGRGNVGLQHVGVREVAPLGLGTPRSGERGSGRRSRRRAAPRRRMGCRTGASTASPASHPARPGRAPTVADDRVVADRRDVGPGLGALRTHASRHRGSNHPRRCAATPASGASGSGAWPKRAASLGRCDVAAVPMLAGTPTASSTPKCPRPGDCLPATSRELLAEPRERQRTE